MKKIKNLADLRERKRDLEQQQQKFEKDIMDRWVSIKRGVLHQENNRHDGINGNGKFEHVFEGVLELAGEALAKNLAQRVSHYFFSKEKE